MRYAYKQNALPYVTTTFKYLFPILLGRVFTSIYNDVLVAHNNMVDRRRFLCQLFTLSFVYFFYLHRQRIGLFGKY